VSSFVHRSKTEFCPRALGLLLLALFAVACSRKSIPPPDGATVLRAISAADPAKYGGSRDSKHWANPYLVIRPEAVALLTSVNPNEEQILKPEQVLNALAQLPASAWPYGRVVAVLIDENRVSSDADRIAIRRSRGIVEADLRSAAVEIHGMGQSE
jgi:hypothetical protein